MEKKRLVAQYDCESDGDDEYPLNASHDTALAFSYVFILDLVQYRW